MKPSPSKPPFIPKPREGGVPAKNPFEEFKTFAFQTSELPLDQIVQSTEAVMDQIRSGYEKLLE